MAVSRCFACSWFAIALTLVLMVAMVIGPYANVAVAGRQADPPLDLAAMALMPADLEAARMDGFGVGISAMGSGEMVVRLVTKWRKDPDGDLAETFDEADAERAYILPLQQPLRAGDPDSNLNQIVVSYLFEFADFDAAKDGFSILADGWETGDAEAVDTDIELGDERVFFREHADDPITGDEYDRADLLMLTGNLVVGVSLQDATGDVPRERRVEMLAEFLIERVEAVLDGDAPGLSYQVVRLELSPNEYLPDVDRYEILEGVPIRLLAETDDAIAERAAMAVEFDLIDHYLLYQPIGHVVGDPDVDIIIHLRHFGSEDAASFWMNGRFGAFLENVPRAEPVDELDAFADEVLALSFADERSLYLTVYIRVGETTATLYLLGSDIGSDADPMSALLDLARAQADCLEAEVCLDPEPIPETLVGGDDERRGRRA